MPMSKTQKDSIRPGFGPRVAALLPRYWLTACGMLCLCGPVQTQTLNLPAALSSGTYQSAGTVTNCTGAVSQANCTAVALNSNASVMLQAGSQIILGPGFMAQATNTSTSLIAMISAGPYTMLSVSSTHTGNFIQGQNGVYTLTVSNQSGAATAGTVTVTETLPSGLTLVSMTGGSAWSCSSNTCTTTNILQPGASYPAITVTASVSPYAPSPETNQVNVSGGGSTPSSGSDPTTIVSPNFTISLSSPTPATVIAGAPASYLVTVASVGGFSTNVALSALGLPSGASASFNPAIISGGSGTSTMTLTSPVSLAASVAGAATVGTLTNTATAAAPLTVQDFTLTVSPSSSLSSPLITAAGQTVTFTVSAAGLNNYSTPVNFSLSVPQLQTCPTCFGASFPGGTVTPGGGPVSFAWFVPSTTYTNVYSYTINGSAPGLSHAVTGSVSIAAEDFTISFAQSPVQTVSSPGSGNFTISLTSINNFAGNVALVGLPSNYVTLINGVAESIPQVSLIASGAATTSFTINFPSGLYAGQNELSILAQSGSIQHSANAWFTVGSSPGSILSVSSTHSGSFTVGQSGTYSVTVTNQAGAGPTSGTVTVTDNLPAGLTLASNPSGPGWMCSGATCTQSAVLAAGNSYPSITVPVNVGLNAPSQVYNQVIVTGSNSQVASATDPTTIQGSASPPNFTLTALQNPQTVAPGGTATYSIQVTPSGSFGNTGVFLNVGAIAGATASITPSVNSASSGTLTVTASSNASFGTIPILIAGTSGATTHYTVANLRVAPVAPAAITTPPPGQFLPGGATQFTWNSGNGASQFTLTVGSTLGAGTYYSGSASSAQSATVSLPSTIGQTVYVTLSSSTPAGVALTPQSYTYVISTQGTTQTIPGLALLPNQPMANVNNNGVEVAYTYNFTGADARAAESCIPLPEVVTTRIIQQTASTITIGFKAPIGAQPQAFTFSCQCPTAPGSGQTNDTPPALIGISPTSVQTPTLGAALEIQGSYFGSPSDDDNVEICSTSGGGCYSIDVGPQSDSLIVVSLPTILAGTYEVSVITDGGESNQESFGVSAPAPPTYDTPPNITSVMPSDIPALSGQAVSIIGTNFGDAGTLTVCAGNCLPYTVSAWNDNGTNAEVDVVVDASSATPGVTYTVTLSTTTDYLGNSFAPAPGAPADSTSASLEVDPAPTVAPSELLITTSSLGIGDCYWPNGAQLWVGYVRVMTYQVVGPGPAHQIFLGSSVPTVSETVTTTSGGNQITGGGVWQRAANPYTISPTGVFTDFLSSNGNRGPNNGPIYANQFFTATGGTANLIVNIQGQQFGTLANSYSPVLVTIANTTSPRACVQGDPN
jgi:uncharacterized repeat protein (TIGR01451 family)